MLETYQPSGRFSSILAGTIIVGLVAAVVLAYVYQTLVWWIPLVWLDWIFVAGLGFGLFFVTHVVVQLGKCRSTFAAIFAGLLISVTALVASHWVSYTQHRDYMAKLIVEEASKEGYKTLGDLGIEDPEIAKLPIEADLLSDIYHFSDHWNERYENGWSIGKSGKGLPLTGVIVYLIWLIEAGVILFAGAIGGISASREPYDETADNWMDSKEIYAVSSSAAEGERIANSNLPGELATLAGKVKLSPVRIIYRLASPVDAREPSYLKIDVETTSKDKDDKDTTSTKTVVTWAKLEPADVKRLMESISKVGVGA